VGSGVLSAEAAAVIGGLSIAFGALTYSRGSWRPWGRHSSSRSVFALVALLAEALSLHLFTQIGVPVSSSQAIVGAVVVASALWGCADVSLKDAFEESA